MTRCQSGMLMTTNTTCQETFTRILPWPVFNHTGTDVEMALVHEQHRGSLCFQVSCNAVPLKTHFTPLCSTQFKIVRVVTPGLTAPLIAASFNLGEERILITVSSHRYVKDQIFFHFGQILTVYERYYSLRSKIIITVGVYKCKHNQHYVDIIQIYNEHEWKWNREAGRYIIFIMLS